jgi:sugar/nucleoside kinase (ribokinase family)
VHLDRAHAAASLPGCAAVSLTVVGSIAFDAVRTPFGEHDRMLGGSAVHFALAAAFFAEVRVVGPVGDDFSDEHLAVLRDRGVDTTDVERVAGGATFFWRGHYGYDMNVAHTDETHLNVFGEFEPKLSASSREAEVIFLANIQPKLQRQVRAQCERARFAALDSMNLWIDTELEALQAAIHEVDCLIINDAEIRQLTKQANLALAARGVMELGPRVVVVKQGEYGAALFTPTAFFALPGFPLEAVRDPTGAGDSFAGGFLGYLDGHAERLGEGTLRLDDSTLRQAMAYGTVLASFNVEDFGTERILRLGREEIDQRLRELRAMTAF